MLSKIFKRIRSKILQFRLRKLSMEGRFTEIYRIGWWADNNESVSGSGSTLANTEMIRQSLPKLIEDLNVKSMLDVPCGDFNWMQHVKLPVGFSYIGADIVPNLIEQNQRNYSQEGRRFLQMNLASDQLPEVDLMMCRDCLFHFSYEDVWSALRNMARSSIPNFLITNMPQVDCNRDIITGQHRLLNLCAAPFNLPQPKFTFDDFAENRVPKVMALWQLDQIKQAVENFDNNKRV